MISSLWRCIRWLGIGEISYLCRLCVHYGKPLSANGRYLRAIGCSSLFRWRLPCGFISGGSIYRLQGIPLESSQYWLLS